MKPSISLAAALAVLAACAGAPSAPTAPAAPAAEERAPSAGGEGGLLEPYGGDRALVQRRVEELAAAVEAAFRPPRSQPRYAGGRSFWAELSDGQPSLVVREASGQETRRIGLAALARDADLPAAPIPDPSGSYVALRTRSTGGEAQWTVVEVETGATVRTFAGGDALPDFGADSLFWSTGGDAVWVLGDRACRSIDRVDLSDGSRQTLWEAPPDGAVTSLNASDDRRLLVAGTTRGLFAIDLEGGPARRLGNEPDRAAGASGPAVWALTTTDDGRHGLCLLDLTRPGSPPVLLHETPEGLGAATWCAGALVLSRLPGPSGAGRELLVLSPSGDVLHRPRLPANPGHIDVDPGPRRGTVALEVWSLNGARFWNLDLGTGALARAPAPHRGPVVHVSEHPAEDRGGPSTARVLVLTPWLDEGGSREDGSREDGLRTEERAPLLRLDQTAILGAPWAPQVWCLLGGRVELRLDATESGPGDPRLLERLAERLIALGLQPRADALERLRARGAL